MEFDAVLIAGPTASGKSREALALAQAINGAIINADSMQVYREAPILTAQPSREDQARVPHLLYGHVGASEVYSVGRWRDDAMAALAKVRAMNRIPIFVGGTGMYFSVLTDGLADIPPIPAAIRDAARGLLEEIGVEGLHARLAQRDPLTASRLRPSDPQRILRALEIFEATGQSLASFQGARSAPLLAPGSWRGFFLDAPRDWLYPRIDARFEAMMELGAVEEAQALMARGLDPALPSMRAHGIPGLIDWLCGRISREEAIARGQADTRHYARRQFTFARRQLPGFCWISPQGGLEAALETPGNSSDP